MRVSCTMASVEWYYQEGEEGVEAESEESWEEEGLGG